MALDTAFAVKSKETSVEHMSRSNLQALKAKTNYTTSWQFTLQRSLIQMVQDTISAFILGWNQKVYSCAKSGHVLAVKQWRAGDIPICANCGKLVMGLSDLEKAVPKDLDELL